MSKILCTFPGRVGDILWSLPTARAISEAAGEPVDFCFSVGPGSGQTPESKMAELLEAQPYIGKAWAAPTWADIGEGQLVPLLCEHQYDQVVNLHYKGWPQAPLAQDIAQRARVEIDLSRPWILPPPDTSTWSFSAPNYSVVVGFSDEWAELKAGLIWALYRGLPDAAPLVLVPPGGSRILNEWLGYEIDIDWQRADLREAARTIANCSVFVGCLSSLAVLAAAMGKPRVLVEPSPARHNPIFQHWDQGLVLGNDGLPTCDARAMVAAVKAKLEEVGDGHR